jgi:hypothetical protein
MKPYRCIFTYSNGHTSAEIKAAGPYEAAIIALYRHRLLDFKVLEVFDGERLAYVRPRLDHARLQA